MACRGVAVSDRWVAWVCRVVAFEDCQEPTELCLRADLVDFDLALFRDDGLMATNEVTTDRDSVDRVDEHGLDAVFAQHDGISLNK